MKTIIPFLIFTILVSCGTAKNQSKETDEARIDPIDVQRIVGKVRISDGCGVLIDAKVGKASIVIIPNNLDEKYQKEGMKIKFFFKNSSMPIPKNCTADARGNVEEVTPLR